MRTFWIFKSLSLYIYIYICNEISFEINGFHSAEEFVSAWMRTLPSRCEFTYQYLNLLCTDSDSTLNSALRDYLFSMEKRFNNIFI